MPDEPLENPDNRLVDNPGQVIENIRRYQTELNKGSGPARKLVGRMRSVSHWYAVESDGRWLFAPSKFIGYVDDDAEDYIQNTGKGGSWHGTKTENRLKLWFDVAPPTVDAELRPALLRFHEKHTGFPPNKIAKIHVLKETSVNDAPVDGEERRDQSLEEPERRSEPRSQDVSSLNTILYGPPGTGKTYATARLCVEICDGRANRSEENIRLHYGELVKEGRVEFITFHQSYGYEEFVEGLRPDTSPVTDDGNPNVGFRLEPTDGALKRIAERARKTPESTDEPFDLGECQIFKMGLGNPYIGSEREDIGSEREEIFGECINNGYILLNRGGDVDWSGSDYEDYEKIIERWRKIDSEATGHNINVQSINQFRNNMKIGDFVIVPAGQKQFCAVGEVTGDYQFIERNDGTFPHRRPVRWHWHDDKGLPISDIYNGTFTPKPIYSLLQEKIQFERLRLYIRPDKDSGSRSPYVLVIDEINRANVSKVLGELVTLLEEDKREGAPNEVAVTLPYSGDSFTLPANLHILGTMNTADRSIALLDTALRRRFEFKELPPDPNALRDAAETTGIDLPAVLRVVNARLEYLIDRDHLIGHAWLMGAKTKADVDHTMRRKIIPLIAEYFHDDWNKVRAVLGGGDDFVSRERLDSPPGLGDDADEERYRWTVRGSFKAGAYDRLISGKAPDAESEAE